MSKSGVSGIKKGAAIFILLALPTTLAILGLHPSKSPEAFPAPGVIYPGISDDTATPVPAPPAVIQPPGVVLAASATPEPELAAATPEPAPAPPAAAEHGVPTPVSCPLYPILLDPDPDLAAPTASAAAMWQDYLGCTPFQLAEEGVGVRYQADWPGACLYPDAAGCLMNAVLLSPARPLYDPKGVIAHELGHLLNLHHGEGPAIMDPLRWGGASTLWCSVDSWCD